MMKKLPKYTKHTDNERNPENKDMVFLLVRDLFHHRSYLCRKASHLEV